MSQDDGPYEELSPTEQNLRDSESDLAFWESWLRDSKTSREVRMGQDGVKFSKSQIDFYRCKLNIVIGDSLMDHRMTNKVFMRDNRAPDVHPIKLEAKGSQVTLDGFVKRVRLPKS